jgi:O-antigen/teichoic acid export membrane protein
VKPLVGKLRELAKHNTVSLIGGSAFLVGLRIAGVATTYITQVLLARWMGAAESGRYIFALAGCVVLFQLSTLGLPAAALRFIPQYEKAGDHGKAVGFAQRAQRIVFFSSIVVAAIAIAAVLFWDIEDQAQLLTRTLAFMSIPFFALVVTNGSIARSISLLMVSVLPNLVLRQVLLFAGVVATYFLLGGLSAPIVAALLLVSLAVLAVGQGLLLRGHLKALFGGVAPEYDTGLWIRTAIPLLAPFAFTQFAQECNVFVAGVLMSPESLAIFNAAYRTSSFVNYGMASVSLLIAPQISRLFFSGDRTSLQLLLAQQAQVRFLFAVGSVVVLVVLGKYLLGLFGEEFVTGYWSLLILVTANLFAGAIGPVVQLLSIAGYEKRCAVIFAGALALQVTVNLILIPLFGIMGAALTVLIVTVFWTTWFHALVVRRLHIEPSILGFRHPRSGP